MDDASSERRSWHTKPKLRLAMNAKNGFWTRALLSFQLDLINIYIILSHSMFTRMLYKTAQDEGFEHLGKDQKVVCHKL